MEMECVACVQEQERRQARQQKQAVRAPAKPAERAPGDINTQTDQNVPSRTLGVSADEPLDIGSPVRTGLPNGVSPGEQSRGGHLRPSECNGPQQAAEHSNTGGLKAAAREPGGKGIEVHASAGIYTDDGEKGFLGKARGRVASDSESLIDSAEDLEHLLGQLVGRAEGLHGNARALAT
jgi:hypothetical protein